MKITSRHSSSGFIELKVDEIETTIFKTDIDEIETTIINLVSVAQELSELGGLHFEFLLKPKSKQSVKTIVEAIEKEIDFIMNNSHLYEYAPVYQIDFDYGNFTFEIEIHEKNEIGGEDDEFLRSEKIRIEVKSVTVTNENSKTLTSLSNEVFNQLELTYTNY